MFRNQFRIVEDEKVQGNDYWMPIENLARCQVTNLATNEITAADRHPLIRRGKGALTDLFADLFVDSMLKELGARAADVKTFCADVIAQLRAGRSVRALKGYPLHRDQIREKLRYYEENLLMVTWGSPI